MLLPLVATLLLAQPASEFLARGMAQFQAGRVADSIQSFDRVITLDPSAAPYLWQRGIALYYAGRFKDCQAQFERHRQVNADDVENAVWHYLCAARAESPARARQQLIPIAFDPRPPMMTVHALFAGKATPDDVMKKTVDEASRFFAALYIGLYWEANGDAAKARPWLKKAAETGAQQDYMGAVARLHWDRLTNKPGAAQ